MSSRVTVSVLFWWKRSAAKRINSGETNAASKKEEDYESKRKSCSRLRRQSLHQQATPRGHELVKYGRAPCCAQLPCGNVSRQKQAKASTQYTAAAAWYLAAESSGRGSELPIGWAAVALIGA